MIFFLKKSSQQSINIPLFGLSGVAELSEIDPRDHSEDEQGNRLTERRFSDPGFESKSDGESVKSEETKRTSLLTKVTGSKGKGKDSGNSGKDKPIAITRKNTILGGSASNWKIFQRKKDMWKPPEADAVLKKINEGHLQGVTFTEVQVRLDLSFHFLSALFPRLFIYFNVMLQSNLSNQAAEQLWRERQHLYELLKKTAPSVRMSLYRMLGVEQQGKYRKRHVSWAHLRLVLASYCPANEVFLFLLPIIAILLSLSHFFFLFPFSLSLSLWK